MSASVGLQLHAMPVDLNTSKTQFGHRILLSFPLQRENKLLYCQNEKPETGPDLHSISACLGLEQTPRLDF